MLTGTSSWRTLVCALGSAGPTTASITRTTARFSTVRSILMKSPYYQNKSKKRLTDALFSGHSRQDSMDPGNLDLDSGRCSCPSSSTHGMKPLERRRKREHQRCLAHSLVGTPNYIAPEVRWRFKSHLFTSPYFHILPCTCGQCLCCLMLWHVNIWRTILFW